MCNLICDMHVHTKYSCDSEAEIEAYCIKAFEKGIHVVCFTDHIDFNINDYGYDYYKEKSFFEDFNYLKEKYKKKLTILSGIEFAEPHLYRDKLAEYSKLPYDFIIGSVHFWYKDMFPSVMVKEEVPAEICYEYYWNVVLAAVKAGGFDVLGHMDFPKRFYNRVIINSEKLNEICREMVRNNICLEINTSSLRKNVPEAMPDKAILQIYKSCGGKYVTIGSDAHNPDDLSADFTYAKKLIEYFGLTETVFIQRKQVLLSDI